jgi:hypothetical protein
VIPIHHPGCLWDVLSGKIPDPVRPITNDDDVGLPGHPASACLGPEPPPNCCGIRRCREIALLFRLDDWRLRSLAGNPCA